MRGSVDIVTTEGAVGWFYSGELDVRPQMQALLYQDVIGIAAADLYRSDLAEVGFGDGRCGFQIRFSHPIDPAYIPFVKIRPKGIDLDIPITGNQSFIDLANAITGAYSNAGRNRSILGGLWTDRIDSAQILAGRVATGMCSAELEGLLQNLIQSGYVALTGALTPVGINEKSLDAIKSLSPSGQDNAEPASKAALSNILGLFFREPVVKLLRQVLEDHPIIYRVDGLQSEGRFAQACSVEPFPSPAECLLLYIGPPEGSARLDVVRNSHELGEIGPSGKSRWTAEGADDALDCARRSGLSLESLDFGGSDVVLVGPGAIHRVSVAAGSVAVRAVCAPRRVTPAKFLSGDGAWREAWHISGAGIRV